MPEDYEGPALAALETATRIQGERLRNAMPEGVGFCLFLFSFGEDGWATFASNADRGDLVEALRELATRLEDSLEG